MKDEERPRISRSTWEQGRMGNEASYKFIEECSFLHIHLHYAPIMSLSPPEWTFVNPLSGNLWRGNEIRKVICDYRQLGKYERLIKLKKLLVEYEAIWARGLEFRSVDPLCRGARLSLPKIKKFEWTIKVPDVHKEGSLPKQFAVQSFARISLYLCPPGEFNTILYMNMWMDGSVIAGYIQGRYFFHSMPQHSPWRILI